MLMTARKRPDAAPVPPPAPPRLEDDPARQLMKAELVALETRLAETDRRRAFARTLDKRRATQVNLSMALDLVMGGTIPPGDSAAILAACDQEEAILRPAIAAKVEELAELDGMLSYHANLAAMAEHNAAQIAAFAALEALGVALDTGFSIQNRLLQGGYVFRADILKSGIPGAAYQLGNAHRWGGQTHTFRLWLEDEGLIQKASGGRA